MDNSYSKDAQVQGIRNARRYLGDRLGRVAAPHKILDPAAGPLIAVRLHILTRKSLGGIQTDLHSRALGRDGHPIDGLYAAGEVAGFGGGGAHGYNALEGTFLGGSLFSGRTGAMLETCGSGLGRAYLPGDRVGLKQAGGATPVGKARPCSR